MANLSQLREDSARISRELREVIVEARNENGELDMERVRRLNGSRSEKEAWMKQQREVLNDLGAQIDSLENLESIAEMNERVWEKQTRPINRFPQPVSSRGRGAPAQLWHSGSLKELITESQAFKDVQAGRRGAATIEIPLPDFKTLVTLANISPQADRLALQQMGVEDRLVSDLPLQSTTDRSSLEYYAETTFTNNAAPVAEGIAKPESALGWTLVAEPIRKMANTIPATDEVLNDNAFLEGQLRGRLSFMVQRTEEQQVLSGSGTAPQLLGFLNRPGIQTYAKQAADTNVDALYQAIQRVRGVSGSGFAEPDAIVLNPGNFTAIVLLKTTDGAYIWGHPSAVGPDRIWGKLVRQTTAITLNTALVGAFRPHSEVIRRSGITVTISTEHANNFVENKVTILAESRLALCVYRPSAFCTVTALT